MPPRVSSWSMAGSPRARDVAAGERGPDALEEREAVRQPFPGEGDHPLRRVDDGEDAAGERAEEDGDEGRPAHDRERQHEGQRGEVDERRMEGGLDARGCTRAVELHRLAQAPEEQERHEERGPGGPERLAEVLVEVGPGGGAGEVGGAGERRELVAEIGAGDHRAGGDGGIEPHLAGHPHQADAEGAGDGPGAADRHGDHEADQAGGRVEVVGAEELQPVVDHGDQRAAERPGADQCSDRQQDEDRRQPGGDARDGGVAQVVDRVAVPPGDGDRQERAEDQRHLVRARRGGIAEQEERQAEQDHERRDRDERRREAEGYGCVGPARHWALLLAMLAAAAG